jgi:hypothetical protein
VRNGLGTEVDGTAEWADDEGVGDGGEADGD